VTLLGLGALPAVATAQPLGHTHPRLGSETSTNWAGYDATGGPFTSVTATWTEPAVPPSDTDAYADFWVGLDGDQSPDQAQSQTVEQIGTEGYSQGDAVGYDVWYEMYPQLPVTVPLAISPGDAFTATVTTDGESDFTLAIDNDTTGASYTTTKTLADAQLSSAEVIAEAPYDDGVLPLADFGLVNFTACAFDGEPVGDFAWNQIDMASDADVAEADTSALGSNGASFSVSTYLTPPTTTVHGNDASWHNRPVSLTFTASDHGGPGVAYTEYSLDNGLIWTKGTSLTIPAPADHANDGVHTILCRSADEAGNVETPKSCTVKIDTRKPTPLANWAATGRSGHTATLIYYISAHGPEPPTADVTIRIRTSGGHLVRKLVAEGVPVNKRLMMNFDCRLAAGRYRFYVYVTDAAGNTQARVASNRLAVN
jgi:hypothetical protein